MVDPIDLREFGRLEAKVEAQGREIGELKETIGRKLPLFFDAEEIARLKALGRPSAGFFVSEEPIICLFRP